MSDRGLLFLFSLIVVLASLGTSGWLIATDQAGTVDGLFMLLTCLLAALVFGLYLVFMVRRAMESATAATQPAAKTAAQKPSSTTSSQPVQTS